MRPNIPQYLAEEIDKIYKDEGYGSKTAFVKDAVRIHIERSKQN